MMSLIVNPNNKDEQVYGQECKGDLNVFRW